MSLFIDSLVSVGAVEAGDNEPSRIMFWKKKEPAPGRVTKEGKSMAFDIDTLDDAAREYVESLQAQLASHAVEEPATLPDDLPDAVVKALDKQTATIAKMEVEKTELAKSLAKLEDRIATEKFEHRADELKNLLGDPAEMAPVLKALAQSAPDEFAKLNAQFDTLLNLDGFKAVIEKEYGSSEGGGSANDKITAIATEIRKNNPDMTPADARAQAWAENPALVKQSREEG